MGGYAVFVPEVVYRELKKETRRCMAFKKLQADDDKD